MKCLPFLFVPVGLWALLITTSRGVLVRYDPMFVTDDNVITDAACTYSSGLRSATILVTGQPRGAECSRLLRFGSIPICQGEHYPTPGQCEENKSRE